MLKRRLGLNIASENLPLRIQYEDYSLTHSCMRGCEHGLVYEDDESSSSPFVEIAISRERVPHQTEDTCVVNVWPSKVGPWRYTCDGRDLTPQHYERGRFGSSLSPPPFSAASTWMSSDNCGICFYLRMDGPEPFLFDGGSLQGASGVSSFAWIEAYSTYDVFPALIVTDMGYALRSRAPRWTISLQRFLDSKLTGVSKAD